MSRAVQASRANATKLSLILITPWCCRFSYAATHGPADECAVADAAVGRVRCVHVREQVVGGVADVKGCGLINPSRR
jgi:hypothetical protein